MIKKDIKDLLVAYSVLFVGYALVASFFLAGVILHKITGTSSLGQVVLYSIDHYWILLVMTAIAIPGFKIIFKKQPKVKKPCA
jgi:uncharacterized membrane protein